MRKTPWVKSDNENERETELYPCVGGKASKLRVIEVILITIGIVMIIYSYWYSRVDNQYKDREVKESSISK